MQKSAVAQAVLATVVTLWGGGRAFGQARAIGVDCSFSQLNWQAAANAGYEFGWAESTNGSTVRTAFAFNITAAPQATFTYSGTVQHVLVGAYHFDHPDQQVSNGMTPQLDVGYFLNTAGNSLTAGHLLPILDQEVTAAAGALSFSTYATQFSNALYAAKGIRPIFYSSESLTSQLSAAAAADMSGLWIGRPTFTDAQAQTGNPDQAVSNPYGGFGSYSSQPWMAWQYADDVTVGSGNVDKDVAHGDLDYLLNYTIPALWTSGTSGNWNTTTNWNCTNLQTNLATIPGSIQNCNVSLISAAAGTINVTLSSGTQNIRSLDSSYNLNISGTGNLAAAKGATLESGGTTTVAGGTMSANVLTIASGATLNQTSGRIAAMDWVWLNTTFAGQIVNNGALNVSGGSVTGPLVNNGTLTFANGVTVTGAVTDAAATAVTVQPGGSVTFNGSLTLGNGASINMATSLGAVEKLVLGGDLTYTGTNSAASIVSNPGSGQSAGIVSLASAMRIFTIADGSATTDFTINTPVTSGGITKSGAGTMALTGSNSFAGGLVLSQGYLLASSPSQLGTGNVTSTTTVLTAGSGGTGYAGTLQLLGSNTYNPNFTMNGAGAAGVVAASPGNVGALNNASGTNTWAGTVTMLGAGANGSDPTENQIGATSGTLAISGVLGDASGATSGFAKTGAGDLVLTGASPNTYKGMTRLFGGRIILEKDGALGAPGSATTTSGNFFQLANSQTTLAFRAPAGSSGFDYSTYKWINTDGSGTATTGQIDNLGGNNTFDGFIALGGPVVSSVATSSIGVSSGSLLLTNGIYSHGSAGARNIVKMGSGTLLMSGDSGVTSTNTGEGLITDGVVTISAGAVTLLGTASNTANLPAIHGWLVNLGTTLTGAKAGALGPAGITLSGGTLAMAANFASPNAINLGNGGATLDTAGNTATFSGAVTGTGGLRKAGNGNLWLTGAVNQVTAGAVTISAGAVTLGANGGAAGVAKISSLSIAGGSTLDLNNNDLVVDYSPGNSPMTTIRGYLVSGFNSGNWNGPGLTSFAAANDPTFHTALGYGDSGALSLSSFSGQTVDSSAVLIKYTYYGDSDLDGAVTPNDFGMFLDGLAQGGSTWAQGDYSYDGKVDLGNDFNLFLSSYLAGGGLLGALDQMVQDDGSLSAAQRSMLMVMVPEPSSVGIMVGIGAWTLQRRRKTFRC